MKPIKDQAPRTKGATNKQAVLDMISQCKAGVTIDEISNALNIEYRLIAKYINRLMISQEIYQKPVRRSFSGKSPIYLKGYFLNV